MVNIKLAKDWSITSDSHQWILNHNERQMSFFMTLEGCIESYFELKIRGSDARTISGLIEYHKSLVNSLKQALTPLQIDVVVRVNPRVKNGGVRK